MSPIVIATIAGVVVLLGTFVFTFSRLSGGGGEINRFLGIFFGFFKFLKTPSIILLVIGVMIYIFMVFMNNGDYKKPLDDVTEYFKWKHIASVQVSARELAAGKWCYQMPKVGDIKVISNPNFRTRFVKGINSNGKLHSSEVYTVESNKGLKYPAEMTPRQSDLRSIKDKYGSNVAQLAEIRMAFVTLQSKNGWMPIDPEVGRGGNIIKSKDNACVGIAISNQHKDKAMYYDGIVDLKFYQQ